MYVTLNSSIMVHASTTIMQGQSVVELESCKFLRKAFDLWIVLLEACLYISIQELANAKPQIVIHSSITIFNRVWASSSSASADKMLQ